MPDAMQDRLVHVEFLRPGPPHNQLLSPLTQYLATCGDAGAGVVTVPYEHAEFERRLKELRYETGDPTDRQAMLQSIGTKMGEILGAVPGLPGALASDPSRQNGLIHLRLTLSASELALLPFEVAKVPVSSTSTSESWLSIQTRPPICLTRNIRTVSPEGVVWPKRPRILFISGNPEDVPFSEHRRALLNAIAPFQYPRDDDYEGGEEDPRQQFGALLTILVDPTLSDVFRECRDSNPPYTHIHILTHGDLSETSPDSYGLVLRGEHDGTDVVSGDQVACALTSVATGRIHRPAVVTVASCDSGNVGTVVIPGASFAHALHQAGIPLVVASQFPLSKEGSIPLAASLYEGLLWGKNPLVLLQQLRAELHLRYTTTWHDWASLVVYEALPQVLVEQLEELRYFQTKRAINAALERIDAAVKDPSKLHAHRKRLDAAIEDAVRQLPLEGAYGVECTGLRASSRKRLAQAAFTLAGQSRAGARWRDPYELLEEAWRDYDLAVRGLLVNDGRAAQRVATLHWVMVQVVALSAIMGKDRDDGRWTTAKLSAEAYRDHPNVDERAWAQGSLAELWLVRLADSELTSQERRTIADRAVDHARALALLYPSGDPLPIKSTRRQFERYVDWWGSPRFHRELATRRIKRGAWDGPHSVVATAERVVAALRRRAPADDGGNGPAPSSSKPGPPARGSKTTSGAASVESNTREARLATASAPAKARPSPARARKGAFFDVEMLPAGHGDSLWIEYGDGGETHRWLVDCGTQQTARELLRRVDGMPAKERRLELFVMSHIDSDHIGGALPFLKALRRGLKVGDVWFNGWRHLSGQLGAMQGEMFSTAIQDLELPWNEWRDGGPIVIDDGDLPVRRLPGGMELTLLSPTKDKLRKLAPVWTREMKRYGFAPGSRVDYSRFLKGKPSTSTDVDELAATVFDGDAAAPNGTSIAILAEFRGASVLLGADAHAPVLVESIRKLLRQRRRRRLEVGAFKVSHHASQNNVSNELLDLLDCRHYLVSTNGDHFYHPDREAIARIIKHGGPKPAMHFNYSSAYSEVWGRPDLQQRYEYTAEYPPTGAAGSRLSLL